MIRTMLALSLRTSAGNRAPLLLPVVAFGVVTTLLLTVIGGSQSFWGWTDDEIGVMYPLLAGIALVLLTVPLITLSGAAARLSARRRDERLATFRLLGATSAAVAAVTVVESAALAFIGAIGGVAIALAVAPLVALIPFRGEPLGVGGVLLPWWAYALVVFGVTLVAVVSSVVGLRGVVISPLGVRTRQDAPKLHWVRALVAVAVIGLAFGLSLFARIEPGILALAAVLVVGFGGTMAVLNLVGPLLIGAIAKRQAKRAKTPVRLVSARRITEDPRAAWRQVSGIAMTSFMSVFVGCGVALLGAAGDPASGSAPSSEDFLITDIRTGILITVVGSFLMVACAAGVTQAADILDRRELSRSLGMLGMDFEVLDAARTRSVMSPLRVTALFSALAAVVLVFPLVGITLVFAPLTILAIAAVLAAGSLLVWAAVRTTRPLLRQAATP